MSRPNAQRTALLRPPRITGRPKVVGLAVQGERSESRSDTEGALDCQNGDLIINSAGEDEAPTDSWEESMQPHSAISSSIAEDRLWTVDDVSYYLGVPVQTLYWWRVEGLGPRGLRVGRHLRYRSEDVKAWAAMQAEAS